MVCEEINEVATLRTCTDGKWLDLACDRGVCNPDGTACGCNTGDYKCEEIDSQSLYSTCDNGNWVATPCEDVSCGPNGKCGECKNETIVCKSGHEAESVCLNGVYVEDSVCENT